MAASSACEACVHAVRTSLARHVQRFPISPLRQSSRQPLRSYAHVKLLRQDSAARSLAAYSMYVCTVYRPCIPCAESVHPSRWDEVGRLVANRSQHARAGSIPSSAVYCIKSRAVVSTTKWRSRILDCYFESACRMVDARYVYCGFFLISCSSIASFGRPRLIALVAPSRSCLQQPAA